MRLASGRGCVYVLQHEGQGVTRHVFECHNPVVGNAPGAREQVDCGMFVSNCHECGLNIRRLRKSFQAGCGDNPQRTFRAEKDV